MSKIYIKKKVELNRTTYTVHEDDARNYLRYIEKTYGKICENVPEGIRATKCVNDNTIRISHETKGNLKGIDFEKTQLPLLLQLKPDSIVII